MDHNFTTKLNETEFMYEITIQNINDYQYERNNYSLFVITNISEQMELYICTPYMCKLRKHQHVTIISDIITDYAMNDYRYREISVIFVTSKETAIRAQVSNVILLTYDN